MYSEISKITIEQRKALWASFDDIIMSTNITNANIDSLIKYIISSAISLKKYDVLQNLANNNLI